MRVDVVVHVEVVVRVNDATARATQKIEEAATELTNGNS